MKQINKILLVFILSLIGAQSMAQEEKTRKWDISISFGQAAPIGSYSKVVPEEISYSNYPSLHFYKEGNSAAKSGGFQSLEVSYLLNKHWFASIVANRSRNSVNSKPIEDYLNSKLDPYYTVTSDNYVVNLLAVGMGYQIMMKKLGIRIMPILGDASISSPEYHITLTHLRTNEIKNYYFDVPVKQNAIMLGFNTTFRYELGRKFYIGLKTAYYSANFNYVVGDQGPGILYNDVINYRQIETGIVLGIKL